MDNVNGNSMPTTLTPEILDGILLRLRTANLAFAAQFPGDSGSRQPVHTVYGGAQIFKSDTTRKLGTIALAMLNDYAPDFLTFAKAIDLRGAERLPKSAAQIKSLSRKLDKNALAVKATNEPTWLAYTIYNRVIAKLQLEPIEDYRIDFEDGYGNRPDSEEDYHAAFTAEEVARGLENDSLPPFFGIRVKPLTEELKLRSIRTLDIFLTTLVQKSGGRIPNNLTVTIPKITIPEQVSAIVDVIERLEAHTGLPHGSLRLEIMIETPQAIINSKGELTLPGLVSAARGRLVAAHFGAYDYTALCDITASHQSMTHPACDFARHMMKVGLAQSGVAVSDSVTTVMPIPRHRTEKGEPLTVKQKAENRTVIHQAWRMAFDDINHSLVHGYYQGWDLHPGQIPIRYAAVYAFFLEGLAQASSRLKTFMDKAAQGTLVGNLFDDAATGQGLLNFFLRGLNCGAITEVEAMMTGLTIDELRMRSFVKISNGRRGK
jgi:citrate lyase beta subunit